MQFLKLAGNRAMSPVSTPTKASASSPQAPPTAATARRPPLNDASPAAPLPSSRPRSLLAAAAAAAAASALLAFSPVPSAALASGIPDLPGCSLATAEKTHIQFCDAVVGAGASPSANARVRAHYPGRLSPGGAVFDSSYERRRPLEFKRDQVVKGWGLGIWGDGDQIPAMREGGKRRLVIPPELAYGERGAGGVIPGNATLVFDVELLGPRKAR